MSQCEGKIPYSRADAERAAEAMEAKTGEAFNAYKCGECVDWHIGHTKFKESPMGATTTAVTKPNPVANLRSLLDQSKAQIALALPQHMTADRMVRVAITAIQKQPNLLKCTPISVIGCVIEASQLGLYPDGILGDAYLVPFWNGRNKQMEAQLQPGYRGLINLARRSGQVSAIYSEPVYQCDKFKVELGTEHTIVHTPNYDDPKRGVDKDEIGVPVGLSGVYAVVKFKDGTSDFEYMPLHRIMDIRNNSKSKNKEGEVFGPWATHFEEMARKTPIRRLAKRLPLSPEFQKAAILDEYVDAGVVTDMTADIDLGSEAMRLATESKAASLDDKYRGASSESEAAVAPSNSPNPPAGQENDETAPAPETISPQERKRLQTEADRQKSELREKFPNLKTASELAADSPSQPTGKPSPRQVEGIPIEFEGGNS
jgi:recombination protein RecT